MDVRGSNSHSRSSTYFEIPNTEQDLSAQDDYNAFFINYAAMAWHGMRRAWRDGYDTFLALPRNCNEQVERWVILYPGLLSSQDPVDETVPLSKMVKFLNEIWGDTNTFVGKRQHDSDSSDDQITLRDISH